MGRWARSLAVGETYRARFVVEQSGPTYVVVGRATVTT